MQDDCNVLWRYNIARRRYSQAEGSPDSVVLLEGVRALWYDSLCFGIFVFFVLS